MAEKSFQERGEELLAHAKERKSFWTAAYLKLLDGASPKFQAKITLLMERDLKKWEDEAIDIQNKLDANRLRCN